jgi:hypothetical protein
MSKKTNLPQRRLALRDCKWQISNSKIWTLQSAI